MKELVEAVRTYGKGIGTDIVKVDMFLNHRLDTNLLVKMGQAFADVFACEKPDLVLTIEASGIAAALTTAMACGNIPVVFAKKSSTRNVTGDVYESTVFSFTHGRKPRPRGEGISTRRGAGLDHRRFSGQRRSRRGAVRSLPSGRCDRCRHRHLCGKGVPARPSEAGEGRVQGTRAGEGFGH